MPNQSTVCEYVYLLSMYKLNCYTYVNDFVSFSGIGIELGNLSGHQTLITFCKLIANYMYIVYTFS